MRAFGSTRAEQDAMSPINFASQVRVPVYLAAGARDPRTPPEHTTAMAKALEAAGNPPEGLILQSGEEHGFYKEENNLKLYTEMLAFFDRHIGSATSVRGSRNRRALHRARTRCPPACPNVRSAIHTAIAGTPATALPARSIHARYCSSRIDRHSRRVVMPAFASDPTGRWKTTTTRNRQPKSIVEIQAAATAPTPVASSSC